MPCGRLEQSMAKCDRKICQTMFCRENAADVRGRSVIRTFHQKSKLEPCGFCVWNTVLSCCLILLCCHCDISAFPTKREGGFATRGKRQINDVNVQSYLMSFGYLPQSDFETGNLRSDDQLKDALRTLQTFGNIPATGKMDEATKLLLRKPRCGLPDISTTQYRSKRYTLNGQRWHHTNLTWSLQTQNPRNLDGGLVRAELHRALDIWAQHSQLTFREINSDRADILVYFHTRYHGDGYAFDGRGQILAHAFFPGSGRGGDAHFDEDEIWTLQHQSDVEGTSLFAVAAHEFGHSLGLSHSSVEGALMYPWYQGLKADFQLPDDDRHGIQQIYGPKDGKLWGKIPVYEPVEPPRTPRPTKPPRARPTTMTPTPTKQPQPPPPPKHPPKKYPAVADKPDTCDTSYDAISVIRREVFIFKGRFLWRVGEKGLYDGYPAEIGRLWYNLPKNLTHVDAVYERLDTKIVFFVGRQYFLYGGNQLEAGYPRPITDLGLPDTLDQVDAAMVWGHNKKTYLFSGTMYWRFDEDIGKVELDYPRDMSMWKGVGYNIDTVFQWKDGKTYFFKGKGYWKFNDLRMQVENEKLSPSAPFWMGCPRELENPIDANERELFTQTSATTNITPSIIMLALAFFVHFSHL